MTRRKKKIAVGITAALLLAAVSALIVIFFRPILNALNDLDGVRAWVDARGAWAPVVFVLIVTVQVVMAFIPGEPVEIAAGCAFGAVEGTILCVIGAAIGSTIVFLLVRRYGMRVIEFFFEEDKIESLNRLVKNKKTDVVIFLLMLLPGTPKDLICYFAGLTDMKLLYWVIGSSIARLPTIIMSAAGGSVVTVGNTKSAVIIFAVSLVVSVIGFGVYSLISRRKKGK